MSKGIASLFIESEENARSFLEGLDATDQQNIKRMEDFLRNKTSSYQTKLDKDQMAYHVNIYDMFSNTGEAYGVLSFAINFVKSWYPEDIDSIRAEDAFFHVELFSNGDKDSSDFYEMIEDIIGQHAKMDETYSLITVENIYDDLRLSIADFPGDEPDSYDTVTPGRGFFL